MNSETASKRSTPLRVDDVHVQATDGIARPLRTLAWSGQAILDACCVRADYGHLLALTTEGALHGIDLDTGSSIELCGIELPPLPHDREDGHFGPVRYRLHASRDGTHAAVVVDRGRHGIVVDTRSGVVTMRLDGGDYCEGTVPFSACFVRLEGRDVFVHRTAWNRLDAADPATGTSLTHRDIAPHDTDDEEPEHHLDYFHGRLRPSPDASLLFDDGWVWQPVSVPRVWSTADWLRANPWESEDGSSVVELPMRDAWTQPACWIDARRLAQWGMPGAAGGAGVSIVDVTQPEPSTQSWPMDGQSRRVIELLSDGTHLFVVDDAGTTAWDIASRTVRARFAGFCASFLNRDRNALVARSDSAISELRLVWRDAHQERR